MIAADAPEHSYRDAEHCDGKWLVIDFSWRTGPVCGDTTATPSGCTSRLGDRVFFRAEPAGWKTITASATGGCTAVQTRGARVPTALCAALAPLSASLHPSYPPPSASATPDRTHPVTLVNTRQERGSSRDGETGTRCAG